MENNALEWLNILTEVCFLNHQGSKYFQCLARKLRCSPSSDYAIFNCISSWKFNWNPKRKDFVGILSADRRLPQQGFAWLSWSWPFFSWWSIMAGPSSPVHCTIKVHPYRCFFCWPCKISLCLPVLLTHSSKALLVFLLTWSFPCLQAKGGRLLVS